MREVSRRLGVSTHSLYKWMKLFGDPAPKNLSVDHEAENRRLKRELARVTEECVIQKGGNGVLRARVPMKCAFFPGTPRGVRGPGQLPGAAGRFQWLLSMA